MKRIGNGLSALAGGALAFITLLICVDVILRALREPIPGSYDIVEFSTAIMISLGILRSFQNEEQIKIDIAEKIFPKKLLPFTEVFSHMTSSLFLGILSAGTILSGISSYISGEVSMTLGLPTYPIYLAIGLTTGLACFSEAIKAKEKLVRLLKPLKLRIVRLGREKA